MKNVEFELNRFNKIDSTKDDNRIHLWESRREPYFEYFDHTSSTTEELPESSVTNAIYEHFNDIITKIMCGKSFVSPKVEYFVRLFLTDEEEGHFIVKYSNADIIITVPVE